jgi:hypothetical protein
MATAATVSIKHAPQGRCTNRRRVGVSSSGRVLTVAGGRFRCCSGCAVRYGWSVSDFIQRGCQQSEAGSYLAMLTLTEPAKHRGWAGHTESVRLFLPALWDLLGRETCPRCHGDGEKAKRLGCGRHTPVTLPYVLVRELQGRGAWHSHIALRNWRKVDLEKVRALAMRYGLGQSFRIDARRVSDDRGGQPMAAYMAKSFGSYLSKTSRSAEHRQAVLDAMPGNGRLVASSRDWIPGETLLSVAADRVKTSRNAKRKLMLDGQGRDFDRASYERKLARVGRELAQTAAEAVLARAGFAPEAWCEASSLAYALPDVTVPDVLRVTLSGGRCDVNRRTGEHLCAGPAPGPVERRELRGSGKRPVVAFGVGRARDPLSACQLGKREAFVDQFKDARAVELVDSSGQQPVYLCDSFGVVSLRYGGGNLPLESADVGLVQH